MPTGLLPASSAPALAEPDGLLGEASGKPTATAELSWPLLAASTAAGDPAALSCAALVLLLLLFVRTAALDCAVSSAAAASDRMLPAVAVLLSLLLG